MARLPRVALIVLGLTLTPAGSSASVPGFGEPLVGPQRVLVILATWGPQPFNREEVRRVVFDEVDAFYRDTSYGKMSLTGTVTPWVRAYDGPTGCNLPSIRAAANVAAASAGFEPSAYGRVIYVHPDAGCPWSGITTATSIFLNGDLSRRLVAHELGHSFGLAHSNSSSCRRHGCAAEEYGDPYDTMGGGTGDFSASAKFALGWITRIARPSASGTYAVDALEQTSSGPQAFVVTTAGDEYWIEYRTRAGRSDPGRPVAGPGVILRVSPSPDVKGPGGDVMRNVLLANPSGRGHPELRSGERFVDPGSFALSVAEVSGSRVRLRFRWTDTVPPSIPQFSRSVFGLRLRLAFGSVRESGSGLSRYAVSLDGRPVTLGDAAVDAPVTIGRAIPGAHTVRVVAVDRAGNRSQARVQRFRIP